MYTHHFSIFDYKPLLLDFCILELSLFKCQYFIGEFLGKVYFLDLTIRHRHRVINKDSLTGNTVPQFRVIVFATWSLFLVFYVMVKIL